jgi:predicted ATPase/class 3 adenylate cyclase
VRDLPTGTLTLLFTDIQGSTRLVDELGDRWAAVLADHNQLLRDVFTRHGGVEVDRQGDAFFVVFTRVDAAAAAAAESQRALVEHPWPEGEPLRVRMGLHTGQPVVMEDMYLGLDVHKAARICSAAHGGQVLLSAATRTLLGGPARDLGEFRLRDLTARERLYQLEVEGVPSEFPPPNTLTSTNLPTQPMLLVGRHAELDAGLELLQSDARLVTLTGAGGSGKTHLALQIAADVSHEFVDGVYWVPLAPLTDPAAVEDAISTVVGAPPEHGGLVRFLRDRELLLLLDNFEQVIAAAPLIGEVLAATSSVKILVTSRLPLRLSSEYELAVPPLTEKDALELFVEGARALRPTFEPDEAALGICRRLDCMPLALKLAAARLKHLTASGLLSRLDRSLDLLTGGARDLPERQQTLRATIEWSYRLLSPAERQLFDRLAVFAGRAPLEQAEIVCAIEGEGPVHVLDGLASLADHNLVRVNLGEVPHYFMLETVHEFALERLAERGEEALLRRRHRDAYLALVERVKPIFVVAGITALVPERNNLRAALRWSLAEDGESDETLRLAFLVWRYWLETGSIVEGRKWLEAALASSQTADAELCAQALDACALLAAEMGEFARAVQLSEEAVAMARSLPPRVRGWCLQRRGAIDIERGRLEEAAAPLAEAAELFRAERWPLSLAWAELELGRIALMQGRTDEARYRFEEIMAYERGDVEQIAFAYAEVLLGSTLGLGGDVEGGLDHIERGLSLLIELGAQWTLAVAYLHVAPVYHAANTADRERDAVARAIWACRDSGIVPRGSTCLEAAARVAVDAGKDAEAARLWGAADRTCEDLDIVRSPLALALRSAFEDTARTRLGEERFRHQHLAGSRMTLDEAFELGLHAIDRPGVATDGRAAQRPDRESQVKLKRLRQGQPWTGSLPPDAAGSPC